MYEAVEENVKNLDIDPVIGPGDAMGRLYQGKEKTRRVRHMRAGKKPSMHSWAGASYRS
ncbi:hypothetical protein LINPERHAP1_LOCUS8475 [Linum perenne]